MSNKSRSPSTHKLGLRQVLEGRLAETRSLHSAERILADFFWRSASSSSDGQSAPPETREVARTGLRLVGRGESEDRPDPLRDWHKRR